MLRLLRDYVTFKIRNKETVRSNYWAELQVLALIEVVAARRSPNSAG
jgi:hypothetical protein